MRGSIGSVVTAARVLRLGHAAPERVAAYGSGWLVRAVLAVWLMTVCPLIAGEQFNFASAGAAAEKGNPNALYFLAKCYAKGDGVSQDYRQAAGYLRAAAGKGCVFAANDLGALYAKGLGVGRDYTEAARWYRKAAKGGDPLAQYSLGRAYWIGRGVATNVPASLKWLRKAAKGGQPDSMLLLGEMYLSGGPGLESDARQAFHWLMRAADAGSTGAFYLLGDLFQEGTGVRPDAEFARNCYLQAAERRDARAQMRLSELALSAPTPEPDLVEACKWLSLAARNGDGNANHLLTIMCQDRRLTNEQLQEGCRRADDFQRAFGKD